MLYDIEMRNMFKEFSPGFIKIHILYTITARGRSALNEARDEVRELFSEVIEDR